VQTSGTGHTLPNQLTFDASVISCIALVSGAMVSALAQSYAKTVDMALEQKCLKVVFDHVAANRTQDVRILLIDNATGQPPIGIPVSYEQTSHDFNFGAEKQ
jgi:hypothetical protein